MSFARKVGDKYDKKLMETATKAGIDAVKTASKRVAQKTFLDTTSDNKDLPKFVTKKMD